MRILLVDDNVEITDVISYYCSAKNDIDCRVINNAQEGLEIIRSEKFDLILLDLAMPEFSGRDVVKSLKEDGLIESRNIVVFTASSDRRVLDEIMSTGIKEILRKPCSLDDLEKLIKKYRPMT